MSASGRMQPVVFPSKQTFECPDCDEGLCSIKRVNVLDAVGAAKG